MKDEKKFYLTPREMEVLLKITEFDTNAEIAEALSVTQYTVHKHLENIYRKFNVHNRVQLIIKAIQHHVINIEE